MTMVVERMQVGVLVERRPAVSKWADWVWRPVGVLPGAPETPPWTVLGEADGVTTYYAGTAEIVLYSGETETYKHTIEGDTPSIFVVLRRGESESGWTLLLATVDSGEAHAHADSGDDLLEAVPMPPQVLDWTAAFVAQHHVERKFWKRKRDKVDPEALSTGRGGRRPGGPGPSLDDLDD